MKKLFFVIVIMLSASPYLLAQGNNNASGCYPDQSALFWKISEFQYGSRQIDKCTPAYNCHGFAVAYLEGNGCSGALGWNRPINLATAHPCPQDYWIGQGTSGVTSAGAYQNQSEYFRVNNQAHADLVYWQNVTPFGGNHTAVRDKSYSPYAGTKYISKYGADGPLVSHDLNQSWYHILADQNPAFVVSPPEFWAYIPGFSYVGNTSISTGSSTTVNFLNKGGVTYNWTLSNSNASITSGQGTNSVSITGNYGGSVVLTGTLGSIYDPNKSVSYSVTIYVQAPNIYGNYTDANTTNAVLQTVNTVSSGTVTTTVDCGNSSSFWWVKNSGNATFTQSQGVMTMNMPSGGFASFTVYSTCDGSSISRSIIYTQSGGFGGFSEPITDKSLRNFRIATYPNPASDILQLETGVDMTMDVQVVEQSTGKIRKTDKVCNQTDINVSDLKSGVYIVRLSYQGKLMKTERIIVKND